MEARSPARFESILSDAAAPAGEPEQPDFFTDLNLDQVVGALNRQIRVLLVSHMYDLAHGFHAQDLATALFLRAEGELDGRRTLKLREGEPLRTSFGEDSCRRIFGTAAGATTSA